MIMNTQTCSCIICRKLITSKGIHSHFIRTHTESLSKSKLEEDEILVDSIMFRLIQVAENSEKLTEKFKETYPSIPWRAIKGLRNRIVHEYGNVDLTIVYDTVKKDIPELIGILEGICRCKKE